MHVHNNVTRKTVGYLVWPYVRTNIGSVRVNEGAKTISSQLMSIDSADRDWNLPSLICTFAVTQRKPVV